MFLLETTLELLMMSKISLPLAPMATVPLPPRLPLTAPSPMRRVPPLTVAAPVKLLLVPVRIVMPLPLAPPACSNDPLPVMLPASV